MRIAIALDFSVMMQGWLTLAVMAYQENESEYTPAAEGLVQAVWREFERASDSSSLWEVQVRVAEFETQEYASDAIGAWFDQLREVPAFRYDLGTLRPVAVEQLADESRALIGKVTHFENPDWTLEVAVLAVRDGSILYTFLVVHEYSTRLDIAVEVAERTLGLESLEFPPVPGIRYETGPLWDATPRIEHLPEGMTWIRDFYPCIGLLGATPMG